MNATPELTIQPTQPSLLGKNRTRQPAGPLSRSAPTALDHYVATLVGGADPDRQIAPVPEPRRRWRVNP